MPARTPKAVSPARALAFGILRRVEDEGAWASRLLEAIDDERLDPRDLALVHELVLGVLRWRGRLDDEVGRISSQPLARLDPAVLAALRLGAYQILFLDRVPDHAAVGESVALVRAAKRALPGRPQTKRAGPGSVDALAGFVNAVLRTLARNASPSAGSGVAPSAPARSEAESLAAELSHPLWYVARILARFGPDEARALLAANNRPGPVSLRPNRRDPRAPRVVELLQAEGVTLAPSGLVPESLTVLSGNPARSPLFRDGAFWIQDEASQVVPLLFPPPWSGLTADLCAAPGGKAFLLATSGQSTEDHRVVAFEIHPQRAARLAARARTIAPDRLAVVAADMTAAPPLHVREIMDERAAFDRVLVDAPCSGTGVLRRHPEIRWRLEADRLPGLAALQGRLLDTALRLVRPGGTIVYSVCSIEPEEGDGVVDAFLARSSAARSGASPSLPGLIAIDPRPYLPEPLRALVGDDLRMRTFPHRHGCDGFFAAVFAADFTTDVASRAAPR